MKNKKVSDIDVVLFLIELLERDSKPVKWRKGYTMSFCNHETGYHKALSDLKEMII